jgi:hypothetical protein
MERILESRLALVSEQGRAVRAASSVANRLGIRIRAIRRIAIANLSGGSCKMGLMQRRCLIVSDVWLEGGAGPPIRADEHNSAVNVLERDKLDESMSTTGIGHPSNLIRRA